MKKILFLLVLTCSSVYSQEFNCGATYEDENSWNPQIQTMEDAPGDQKFVIKLFIHLVRNSDGTLPPTSYGLGWGEEQVLAAIRVLNINYNPHNIFFKYAGFQYLDNTTMNNFAGSTYNVTYKDGAYNMFWVDKIGDNYSAVATIGNSTSKFTYYALNMTFEKTLVHEIGHNFNLLHIFQNAGTTDCEHVTRIPGPDFNANYAGDGVVDTPAQTAYFAHDTNCTYIYDPNNKDCIGTPYENMISNNFMGYDIDPCSPKHFTAGQIQKMRNYLANPSIQDILTRRGSVEDLYMPFDSEYIVGNIISTTMNSDFTITVCKSLLWKFPLSARFRLYFS